MPGISRISELGASEVWESLLTSMGSDSCLCAYSPAGCRPISLVLKAFFLPIPNWRDEIWEPFAEVQKWEQTLESLDVLATLLERLTVQGLAEDVLRFLTFTAL